MIKTVIKRVLLKESGVIAWMVESRLIKCRSMCVLLNHDKLFKRAITKGYKTLKSVMSGLTLKKTILPTLHMWTAYYLITSQNNAARNV